MKKISIYTQGGIQSAGFRYRFLQYFEKLDCNVSYNKALSDNQYQRFMPIGEKGVTIRIVTFLLMYFRTLFYLLRDLLDNPEYIIIARTIQKKIIPIIHKELLKTLKKKGCIIIWDFDDDILELQEINKADFEFMSTISDHIVIASSYLKNIIQPEFHTKTSVLPTTDGSMLPKLTKVVIDDRKKHYANSINVIWVGTSSGLSHLRQIAPQIDKAGQHLLEIGKDLRLIVVCNRDLEWKCAHAKLINRRWTLSVAEEVFLNAHIGLMPLDNSKASRGKGGFKLIQYLSVGLPSIASSVGINNQILEDGGGYLIEELSSEDWCNNIVKLATNENLWRNCSKEASDIYYNKYNYYENLKIWSKLINSKITTK